jgi:nitric oxide dioxygenase
MDMHQDVFVRVQKSFRDIARSAEAVGTLFQVRLFQRYPELRPLFPTDRGPQARKLVLILAVAVSGLHRLEDQVRYRGSGQAPS